jgi:hypothetical protein
MSEMSSIRVIKLKDLKPYFMSLDKPFYVRQRSGTHLISKMKNETHCEIALWSKQAARTVKPIFYICILATVSHLLFRIQLKAFPAVRKRSMLWLYAYLATDLLLLVRFCLLYAYRWWPKRIPHLLRIMICYCEAILENYLNLLQSYILLALNICRYLQIAHNHNVYSANRHAIIIVHFLIYFLPFFGHIITIIFGWTILQNPSGGVCDLLPVSLTIRIVFLLLSYFIPVSLTLIFLFLSLNHIRNTNGIRAQEIVDARQKYHRQLVIQSSVFYSVWLILWSPHLLLFPFHYKNGTIGNIAQILSYINITLDPIAISALDVRFLRTWRLTADHLMRFIRPQQSTRVLIIFSSSTLEQTIEHSITIS